MNINEERLAFHYSVGVMITQWASVEFSLAGIVGQLYDDSHRGAAIVGFQSIENFRSRLQFVDASLKSQGPEFAFLSDWAKLTDRCQKAASNDLFCVGLG